MNRGTLVVHSRYRAIHPFSTITAPTMRSAICAIFCTLLSVGSAHDSHDNFLQYAIRNDTGAYAELAFYTDQVHRDLVRAAKTGNIFVFETILQRNPEYDINSTDSSGNTLLCSAVGNGHVGFTHMLLNKHADPNAPCAKTTALHLAAHSGHVKIAKILINAGADPSASDSSRKTPLDYAAENGHVQVMKLLLKYVKPDTKGKGTSSFPPLYYAASNGHIEAVELLILKGASLGIDWRSHPFCIAQDHGHWKLVEWLLRRGYTQYGYDDALVKAVEENQLTVAELLLEKGANPNETNCEGCPLLLVAAKELNHEMIVLLQSHGADPQQQDDYKCIPLHQAAANGMYETVKLLLARNIDPNVQNIHGQTLVNCAVHGENLDVVRLILHNGTDPAIPDKNGETPIELAAKKNLQNVVRLLLEYSDLHSTSLLLAAQAGLLDIAMLQLSNGADVDMQDSHGYTPLYWAVKHGHFEMSELLLHNRAAFNKQDNQGRAPLHVAAENGHYEITELLLNHGADPSARDNTSCTPLHLAVTNVHGRIVELLLNNHAYPNAQNAHGKTPLHHATQWNSYEISKFLRQINIAPNTQGDPGIALFHSATWGGHAIIELLFRHGANPNIQDSMGSTPLIWAVENNYRQIVAQLLEYGANPNITGEKNRTPLCNAIRRDFQGLIPMPLVPCSNLNLQTITLLLEYGADPNLLINGHTAMCCAVEISCLKTCNLLLAAGADPSITCSGKSPIQYAVDKWQGTTSVSPRWRPYSLVLALLRDKRVASSAATALKWGPLHSAAYTGDTAKVVAELLDTDATPADLLGLTPLHCAVIAGHHELVPLLKKYATTLDACGRCPLYHAVVNDDAGMIIMLLAHGAKHNALGPDKETLLHIAAAGGHCNAIRVLARVIPVDSRDMHRRAPIHYAALNGHVAAIRALHNAKANVNVNARDARGRTAVHYTAHIGDARAMAELIDTLQADFNAQDAYGITPLLTAFAGSNHETTDFLIGHHAKFISSKQDVT